MQKSAASESRIGKKRRLWRCLAAAALLLAPARAWAAATALAPAPETSFIEDLFTWSKYTIRVGPGVLYRPDYEGSSHYKLQFVPAIDLQWKDVVAIHERSLRVNLVHQPWLKIGPMVSYAPGRHEEDNPHLRGLGDVGVGMEVGGFTEALLGPAVVRFDMQKEVAGGHGGWVYHVELGHLFYDDGKWSVAVGGRLSIAGQSYMRSFFGIDAAQSAASGLPQYHARGGVKDISVGVLTNYLINKSWSAGNVLGCARLQSDAAQSPLVKDVGSRNQCIAYFRLTYQL